MQRIGFRIESRLDQAGLLGLSVRALGREAGLSPGEAGLVEAAVIEAVNNAIEHAYRNEPGHWVEVEAELAADRLVFDVCDRGWPARPGPIEAGRGAVLDCRPEELASIPERGRGLAIIGEVMDAAEYTPGPERNRFRLVKRLRGSEAAAVAPPRQKGQT